MEGLVDFHSHLIPGVDDGARDIDESRAALEAFRDQGVRAVITTPHVDGSLTHRPEALAARLAELDAGWVRLRDLADDAFPDMRVERGAEIMLDVPDPDLSDPRLRLAGSRFVLLEFPHLIIPPGTPRVLAGIVEADLIPIVAHPERYQGLEFDMGLPAEWRSAGAYLQLNAGSIQGGYGGRAERVARALLGAGWIDYVSSDYHARGRPALAGARAWLEQHGTQNQADLLLRGNGRSLLEGRRPTPVPPLKPRRKPLLARIAGLFWPS